MQKQYLIVGGSRGIGAGITKQLSAAGHQVWVGSREANGIDQLEGVQHFKLDVLAKEWSLPDLPDVLHGLVYAPGSIRLKPFHRISEEEFSEDFQINALGAAKAIQHCLKPLRKAKGSSVVLFSTVAVGRGMSFHASIAMAKAAVEGLTRSLASEYAHHKIRFNAIAPSLTDTELAEGLLNTDQKRESAAQRHPLGRIGSPSELAQAATFLLSEQSSWVTGQIMGVDGGLSTLNQG